MSRNVFIMRNGTGSNGRPWAQGCADLSDAEQIAYIRAGGKATARATGIINGIPDDALSRLSVGDVIVTADDNLKVSVGTGKPYTDNDGVEHTGVDVRLAFGTGKVSRTAAPVAQCDW
jgi:hypothetical protein